MSPIPSLCGTAHVGVGAIEANRARKNTHHGVAATIAVRTVIAAQSRRSALQSSTMLPGSGLSKHKPAGTAMQHRISPLRKSKIERPRELVDLPDLTTVPSILKEGESARADGRGVHGAE